MADAAPIAVTCAGGQTGRAVIAALGRVRVPARPLVRRPAGLSGERVVDVTDTAGLTAALGGVSAVYHLAPNMSDDEERMGAAVIAAAVAAGIDRVVFHSVLQPQLRAMPHHTSKLNVEEALAVSPLRWTVLQPAAYQQNFVRRSDGTLPVPFSLDAAMSLVDLRDVAEVAAKVLTEDGHEFATYGLAGPQAVTLRQVAAALHARPVRRSLPDWRRDALEHGMARDVLERFCAMWQFYDRHGLVGNPAILGMLLGRAPRAIGGDGPTTTGVFEPGRRAARG